LGLISLVGAFIVFPLLWWLVARNAGGVATTFFTGATDAVAPQSPAASAAAQVSLLAAPAAALETLPTPTSAFSLPVTLFDCAEANGLTPPSNDFHALNGAGLTPGHGDPRGARAGVAGGGRSGRQVTPCRCSPPPGPSPGDSWHSWPDSGADSWGHGQWPMAWPSSCLTMPLYQ
jgi:hypothetical protein